MILTSFPGKVLMWNFGEKSMLKEYRKTNLFKN
jgi:hypothetical protein